MPKPKVKEERVKPSMWEVFLDRLGILTTGKLASLFNVKQFAAPSSFAGRVPVFMRRVRENSEMVLMSRPAAPSVNDTYAFHTIRFSAPHGFFWLGDFLDAGLQATDDVRQVLAGKLLFVDVGGSNVRVYRTDWLQSPPMQLITTLSYSCPVIDMGTARSDLVTLVLEDGRILHYGCAGGQDDPQLIFENDFIKQQGRRVVSANVVTNNYILVDTIDMEGNTAFWHLSYQGQLVGSYRPINNYSFPVIGKAGLGKRHVTLQWCGYPQERPWNTSIILVTGNATSISVFSFVTGYFQLVRHRTAEGALMDHYSFPETTFDWDVGLDKQTYDGNLKLLRATTEGLRIDTLKCQLSGTPKGGDGTFEVVLSRVEGALGEQRCAFWDSNFPTRGKFSVALNGDLFWSW